MHCPTDSNGRSTRVWVDSSSGFLEHGAEKVALLDIDIQERRRAVAGLVDSFPEKTNSIIFRQLDVTDGTVVQAVTNELSESLGGLASLFCGDC